jgi:hypothetical protein
MMADDCGVPVPSQNGSVQPPQAKVLRTTLPKLWLGEAVVAFQVMLYPFRWAAGCPAARARAGAVPRRRTIGVSDALDWEHDNCCRSVREISIGQRRFAITEYSSTISADKPVDKSSHHSFFTHQSKALLDLPYF